MQGAADLSGPKLSHSLKSLQRNDLYATVRSMPRLSEEVRLRLRDAMTRQKMSQRDVAGILGWSQSKVAHILTGHVELNVDDLAELCSGLRLRVTEAVRDQGLEFCAEMTPTELRLLERIRELTQAQIDALMVLIHLKQKTNAPERHAGPLKKRKTSRV